MLALADSPEQMVQGWWLDQCPLGSAPPGHGCGRCALDMGQAEPGLMAQLRAGDNGAKGPCLWRLGKETDAPHRQPSLSQRCGGFTQEGKGQERVVGPQLDVPSPPAWGPGQLAQSWVPGSGGGFLKKVLGKMAGRGRPSVSEAGV